MSQLRHEKPAARIRRELLEEIHCGRLRAGDHIPPMTALSSRYGVTVKTAHRVVKELAREGYLVSQRGRGTFVRQQHVRSHERKVTVRLRMEKFAIPSAVSGLRSLLERFNVDHDIQAELIAPDTPYDGAEVLVMGPSPNVPLYRLDRFTGYRDIRAAVHNRFHQSDLDAHGMAGCYLPCAWNIRTLVINRSAAGDIQAPKTWDELLQLRDRLPARKRLPHDTYMSVGPQQGLHRLMPFYWMAGGQNLFDPVAKRLSLSESSLTQMFEFLAQLKQRAQLLTEIHDIDPFLSGQYLYSVSGGSWLAQHNRQLSQPLDYTLHPLPTPEPGGPASGVLTTVRLGMVKKDLNEEQKVGAWTLIRYLMSERIHAELCSHFQMLPTLATFWSGWARDPERPVWEHMLNHSRVVPYDVMNQQLRYQLSLEYYRFMTESRRVDETVASMMASSNAIVGMAQAPTGVS